MLNTAKAREIRCDADVGAICCPLPRLRPDGHCRAAGGPASQRNGGGHVVYAVGRVRRTAAPTRVLQATAGTSPSLPAYRMPPQIFT